MHCLSDVKLVFTRKTLSFLHVETLDGRGVVNAFGVFGVTVPLAVALKLAAGVVALAVALKVASPVKRVDILIVNTQKGVELSLCRPSSAT